jgi:CheY-like chemotaxis protein
MSNEAVFLLVEDDVNDATLVRRSFTRARVSNPMIVVRSGEEALEYLSGAGLYANRVEYPLPAVVLLDLKMPGMDGFEVLKWIRAQPGLSTLRVVVLTASDAVWDVQHAYRLGANSFLLKPTDFDKFVEISQALSGHWVWMRQAPEAERPPLADVGLTEASAHNRVSRMLPRGATLA